MVEIGLMVKFGLPVNFSAFQFSIFLAFRIRPNGSVRILPYLKMLAPFGALFSCYQFSSNKTYIFIYFQSSSCIINRFVDFVVFAFVTGVDHLIEL